jgi:hypothetical protein
VDAENSFGAQLRSRFECVTTFSAEGGGTWRAETVTIE